MEQIKLIDVAPEVVDMQVEALPEVGPKLDVIYLVAAYRKTEDGGYWKVHRETQDHEHHESEGGGTWQRPPALERAKAQAKKLAPHWTHRTILRVSLPVEAWRQPAHTDGFEDAVQLDDAELAKIRRRMFYAAREKAI